MAITVAFGAWQLIGSVGDVREAGRAKDLASVGLAAVTLIERLQDERDIAAQIRATGSENPKLRDSYLATDRSVRDFESALRSAPPDTFTSQLNEIRPGLGDLEKLRSTAFAEGQPMAATIDGYGALILPLIRLNDRAVQNAVALCQQAGVPAATSGLSILLLAAEALSQQRVAVTTVLARDRSTAEERQALRTNSRIARESLGAFAADASPPIRRVHDQAGDTEVSAQADDFAARIVGSPGPYAAAGLLPARWASLSSDRLNQIRLTVWTASTDLIGQTGAALNGYRLTMILSAVAGMAVVLLAGTGVLLARRALLTPPGRQPATTSTPLLSPSLSPDWQDPLPRALSHRTQELLDEQLNLISELESTETDPDRLASLFQLDHLATRMRRHGENLIAVTGQPTTRRWPRPLTLLEIIQAAVSESRRYDQIKLTELPPVALDARAVIDTIHLLAELLDNATAANPDQAVTVFAGMWEDGRVVIEIHDRGPGMPFPRRALINARLTGALPDDPTSSEAGLRLVALLAGRHGMQVRLTHPEHSGLAATVTFPADLVVPIPMVPIDTAGSEPLPAPDPARTAIGPYPG